MKKIYKLHRDDNGKLTNVILYGTFSSVALLVVFVIHTISYICDSMSKR